MTAHIPRKAGDKVYVINCTIGGTFFIEGIEGKATVVRTPESADENMYLVDFGDGMPVMRFVNPEAQAQPGRYVDRLNTVVEEATS